MSATIELSDCGKIRYQRRAMLRTSDVGETVRAIVRELFDIASDKLKAYQGDFADDVIAVDRWLRRERTAARLWSIHWACRSTGTQIFCEYPDSSRSQRLHPGSNGGAGLSRTLAAELPLSFRNASTPLLDRLIADSLTVLRIEVSFDAGDWQTDMWYVDAEGGDRC